MDNIKELNASEDYNRIKTLSHCVKNSVIFSDWIISVPVPMVNLEDFKVFDVDKLLVDHAPIHEVVAAKNSEDINNEIDDSNDTSAEIIILKPFLSI